MKRFFLTAGLIVAGFYLLAIRTLDTPDADGTVWLRWATDANPARVGQTSVFSQLNPGMAVSIESGNPQRLIVLSATGVGPDIIDVHTDITMHTFVGAGILLDLTPHAREMGFGLDSTYESLVEALTVDGRQYRFPCNVWANAIVYNREIFDDHGVPYPEPGWTYDDFIEAARAIRMNPSKSGRTHIPVAVSNPGGFFLDLLAGLDGQLFSDDGLVCLADTEKPLRALKLYHDMMFEHRIIPTPERVAALSSQGGWGVGTINWFATGQAAMIPIGRWITVQLPNFPGIEDKIASVPLPRFPGKPSRGVVGARAAAINANSGRITEALAFLRFLASEEYGQMIVDDGDGLPPNPKLARTGEDLSNDFIPDPDFHQTFIDAVANGGFVRWSPFIDPARFQRWLMEALDTVENRIQSPEEAMRRLTAETNREIRRNIERHPHLQRRFEEITGDAHAGR